MTSRRRRAVIAGGAALAWALTASCADRDPDGVTVLAAASLSEAFSEIAAAYEAAHPGAEVALEFAASSTLVAQVRAGTPFDVLATADERTMAEAWRVELVERPVAFATNRIVVIAEADDPAVVRTVEDLARPGTRVVLAQHDVPAGAYARRALAALGIEAAVEANVVSNALDVKAVAAAVALGEADAGIVYASDVTPALAARVRVLPIPERAGVRAVYPIATATDPQNPAGARAFLELVRSPTGRGILAAHGLGAP